MCMHICMCVYVCIMHVCMYIDTVLLSPLHFSIKQSDRCPPQTQRHLPVMPHKHNKLCVFSSVSAHSQISSVVKTHPSSISYR